MICVHRDDATRIAVVPIHKGKVLPPGTLRLSGEPALPARSCARCCSPHVPLPGEAPLDRMLAETERTRPQWIVCGMEAHVCVYQTARALARNRAVFVASDATLSRRKSDWKS